MAGVEFDDITQGMTKYLLSIPEIVELTGQFEDGTPWLSQDNLLETIETSQSQAIVVVRRGSWAAPNIYNTAKFPRMGLEIYVDPLRDEGNNIVDKVEARRRANYIYNIVDKYLHMPFGIDMMWGDVRVIGSVRNTDFDISPVSEGDGVLRGIGYYSISLG
jgi:hypothetical protein